MFGQLVTVNQVNHMLEEHQECRILCISEHWKTDEQLKMFNINNFVLASSFCREEGFGGSAIYIHRDIQFRKRTQINKLSVAGDFECASIECRLENDQFLVTSIYRPPKGNLSVFYDRTESMLSQIVEENTNILIAGDFNIELLQHNNVKADFLSVLSSFQLY